MTTQELQAWLFDRGFYDKGTTREKAVDGRMGNMTRNALRKAQEKLAASGLYKQTVDGKAGPGTYNAIAAWNKGWRTFTGKNGRKFKMNVFEDSHFSQLRDWAAQQGISTISFNGAKFSVGDADIVSQLRGATNDMLAGRKTTRQGGQTDSFNGVSSSDVTGALRNKGTVAASNGGASSFNASDLDNLVMRYAYDKYHGTAIDENQWGIEYNYTPTRSSTGWADITLKISNKWTPEQAAQIARGAGMTTYYYNGKKQNVNLFIGSKYKDLNDFNAQIEAMKASKGLQAAQDMYNAELSRQYQTYGIDFNMLKNKSGYQWNSLFGAVPYGYNAQSQAAILHGNQAYQEAGAKGESSSLGTSNYGYRYNPETGQGRFAYNNFDEWYQGRMLANSKYTRNGGLSGARAVTSTYSLGLPVAQSMRSQLSFVGARPNANDIDRSNYYDITDAQRGSARMQAWLYNEVAKNPTAAYQYFRHIYGDRNSKGKVTRKNGTAFDMAEASRLAKAAGLSNYHLGTSAGKFYQEGSHDPYATLKGFYENAYDENGNLRTSFKYTENGYDHKYDGGNYTVFVNNGKASYAMDDWNIDLGGMGMGMNAGIDGRGILSITRYQRFGGRLLMFCQAGGGLKGGAKRHDVVDTLQCAEWANSLLRENDYDISGNAWALNNVDTLFNGYEGLEKPTKFTTLAAQKYNKAATANVRRNFDSSTLDRSRPYVVNLYYNGSEKQEQAFNEGKGVAGTHTGILTFENGRWMVTHNIHGRIYQDDFIGLQSGKGKWGVTAVYSPRKATTFTKVKSGIRNFFGFKYGGVIWGHQQ